MRILESATLDVPSLSYSQQYWAYNGLDCMITMEVFQALSHSIKEVPFAYNMTRAMQAPAFTLMKRGVKVDMARRGEVLNSLSLQRARAEEIFFRLCTEGLGLEPYFDKKHKKYFAINPASSQQLCQLFYEVLGLPPIKSFNKLTKEYKVSCDRKALEKMQREPISKPFCDDPRHSRLYK